MNVTRRGALAVGIGGIAFAMTGSMSSPALAASAADELINSFTGGAEMSEGGITLTTPEIAENGNTVPIAVSVESAMTDADNVSAVIVLATGNPNPKVVTFNFTTANGIARAKTRIRLAKTQDVIAIAKMGDGSFRMAKNLVKVTIGGCGG